MLEPVVRAPRSLRRGLTLLELTVALAIAAILGLAALPSMSAWLDRQRIRAAAQNLAADLGEAKLESARIARPVHVVFRPGESWCYAIALDERADCRHPDASVLKVVRSAPYPGVAMASAATHVFDARQGTSPAGSGYAQFVSAKGESIRTRVSTLGRPTLCAPEGGSRDIPRCG